MCACVQRCILYMSTHQSVQNGNQSSFPLTVCKIKIDFQLHNVISGNKLRNKSTKHESANSVALAK